MLYSKGWPKTPHAPSDRLNKVTPNLEEIGIVVHREVDAHTKSNKIIIVNNDYDPSYNGDNMCVGPSIIVDVEKKFAPRKSDKRHIDRIEKKHGFYKIN